MIYKALEVTYVFFCGTEDDRMEVFWKVPSFKSLEQFENVLKRMMSANFRSILSSWRKSLVANCCRWKFNIGNLSKIRMHTVQCAHCNAQGMAVYLSTWWWWSRSTPMFFDVFFFCSGWEKVLQSLGIRIRALLFNKEKIFLYWIENLMCVEIIC